MDMSEAWPDTYDKVYYIHQFQPEPTHKITTAGAPILKICSQETPVKWSQEPS